MEYSESTRSLNSAFLVSIFPLTLYALYACLHQPAQFVAHLKFSVCQSWSFKMGCRCVAVGHSHEVNGVSSDETSDSDGTE